MDCLKFRFFNVLKEVGIVADIVRRRQGSFDSLKKRDIKQFIVILKVNECVILLDAEGGLRRSSLAVPYLEGILWNH